VQIYSVRNIQFACVVWITGDADDK